METENLMIDYRNPDFKYLPVIDDPEFDSKNKLVDTSFLGRKIKEFREYQNKKRGQAENRGFLPNDEEKPYDIVVREIDAFHLRVMAFEDDLRYSPNQRIINRIPR